MAERVQCLYRVSTTKQVDHDVDNNADIPMQRKACREFVDRMGWTIVGEEQETGVSGYKVSADDRDKLQLIKKRAEQGKFDILLVFMFDRLGRKSDETPFVVEWFVRKGIRVWSVQEGEQRFESHTDRLTNYIRFWQADGESQKTSIRTKTALGQMVEEGRFRGGKTPYGYRLEKSGILNKRKHEVNKLVIDDAEAEVIRLSSETAETEKKRILRDDYAIPLTKRMERSLTEMCNLSQGVEEKGIAKGLARGRAEGRAEATVTLIRNLMDSASISIEKAMSMLKISEEDREKYIELLEKQ